MTRGRPLPLLLRFALPLMVGNIFQQLYTVVDTMVVGKALGVGALAALGAADWLNWMMLGTIQGLTQGFGVLIAQEFGAKNSDSLHRTTGLSAVLCGIGALILLLLGQVLVSPALRLLQTPDQISANAALYLRIMYGGIPVVMAYNFLACVLRAMGDGRTPLHAMILSSCVNIVLDLLFVLVFNWGIAGAAVATVIAQGCSAAFCLLQLLSGGILHLNRQHYRMDRALAWRLLRLGAAMAFQFLVIAIGGMVVQSVVNGCGVPFIAGFTATNKLYGVLEIAATSFGFAVVTYVGQNLGAGRIDRIRSGQKAAYLLAVATSLAVAVIMLISGKWILGGFLSGTPEEVASAMEVAYYYLAVMSLGLPWLYIIYVARSSVQGMGNGTIPLISGIVEFLMRTGAVLLLPALIGDKGIFFAEVLAWIGADLIVVPGYWITVKKCEKLAGNG